MRQPLKLQFFTQFCAQTNCTVELIVYGSFYVFIGTWLRLFSASSNFPWIIYKIMSGLLWRNYCITKKQKELSNITFWHKFLVKFKKITAISKEIFLISFDENILQLAGKCALLCSEISVSSHNIYPFSANKRHRVHFRVKYVKRHDMWRISAFEITSCVT